MASRVRPGEGADGAGNASSSGGLAGLWESWEGKGSVLLHMDLVSDVLVQLMTLAHYVHVWCLHGITFGLVDAILFLDIRSILMAIAKRVRAYAAYRHATHSLKHAFPDAQLAAPSRHRGGGGGGSAEDAAAEAAAEPEQCAICMERMAAAKQLPCGHMFHLPCLRAWLQQSGTESFACPLCRTPLLRDTAGAGQSAQQQQQQQAGTGGFRLRQGAVAAAEAVVRLASRLYLDVLLSLLVGLPLSSASLHRLGHRSEQERQYAGGRGQHRSSGGGGGGSRGGGGRGRAALEVVERVEENDAPGPVGGEGARRRIAAAAAPTTRAAAVGSWMRRILPALVSGYIWQQGAEERAAGPVSDDGEDVTEGALDGLTTDEEVEEDSFGGLLGGEAGCGAISWSWRGRGRGRGW